MNEIVASRIILFETMFNLSSPNNKRLLSASLSKTEKSNSGLTKKYQLLINNTRKETTNKIHIHTKSRQSKDYGKTEVPPKPARTANHPPNHNHERAGRENGAMVQRPDPEKRNKLLN